LELTTSATSRNKLIHVHPISGPATPMLFSSKATLIHAHPQAARPTSFSREAQKQLHAYRNVEGATLVSLV